MSLLGCPPPEKVASFCTFYRPRAARGTGRSALLSRQQSPFGMAGWAVYDRLGFIFALYLLVHRFDRFEDQLIDGTSWSNLGCQLMTSQEGVNKGGKGINILLMTAAFSTNTIKLLEKISLTTSNNLVPVNTCLQP